MRGRARQSLAAIAAAFVLATATPASASSALELVRIARAHETAHEEDLALRRYTEALSLDPTCDEAYIGLGRLRARRGDLREAERVYNVALEHLPGLRAARLGRAYVRRALGARNEAIDDLLTGAEDDPGALRVLAAWYAEEGQDARAARGVAADRRPRRSDAGPRAPARGANDGSGTRHPRGAGGSGGRPRHGRQGVPALRGRARAQGRVNGA